MAERAVSVTDANFEQEVLRGPTPVIVDFWAPWCGPCLMIAPIIDELAAEYRDRVKFVKVNVDENPDLANRYNVMSIPTLGVFKDGTLVGRIVGYMRKADLKQQLESTLAAGVL
jgi:thioredoxin 1